MTKNELLTKIMMYAEGHILFQEVADAVDAYSSASNDAKPNVSGALLLDDAHSFAEYCGEFFVKMQGGWMPRFADQRNIANLLTTEQVYARWRQ